MNQKILLTIITVVLPILKNDAVNDYKKAIELDKRFAGKIDELIKEGYFYSEPQLKAIKELLKEMGY
jgi:hypothetical protein